MNNMMWYIYIWSDVEFTHHLEIIFWTGFPIGFPHLSVCFPWLYPDYIAMIFPLWINYIPNHITIKSEIYWYSSGYIYTLLYQQHIMGYNPIKSPLYHQFLIHIFSLRFRPSPLTKGTWSSTTCAVPVWSPNGTLRFSTTRPGGGGAKTRHSLEIWSSDVCFTNTMNIHEYYSHKYHTPYLLNTIVCSL